MVTSGHWWAHSPPGCGVYATAEGNNWHGCRYTLPGTTINSTGRIGVGVGCVMASGYLVVPCSIVQLSFSTVIAFNPGAFPAVKPSRIADFFDIEGFPGKRGLRCAPVAMLEWALLAYRIPYSQVYDLLSTDRGLDLAFRNLDRIRPHIVWWHGGSFGGTAEKSLHCCWLMARLP